MAYRFLFTLFKQQCNFTLSVSILIVAYSAAPLVSALFQFITNFSVKGFIDDTNITGFPVPINKIPRSLYNSRYESMDALLLHDSADSDFRIEEAMIRVSDYI